MEIPLFDNLKAYEKRLISELDRVRNTVSTANNPQVKARLEQEIEHLEKSAKELNYCLQDLENEYWKLKGDNDRVEEERLKLDSEKQQLVSDLKLLWSGKPNQREEAQNILEEKKKIEQEKKDLREAYQKIDNEHSRRDHLKKDIKLWVESLVGLIIMLVIILVLQFVLPQDYKTTVLATATFFALFPLISVIICAVNIMRY